MVRTYRCSVADLHRSTGERRRFPALDPEPPPLPWWRQLTIPAAVVVLAGVVVAAVLFWPFRVGGRGPTATTRGPAGAAAAAGGRIVAVTPTGVLALSDPDGTHTTSLRRLGNVGNLVSASSSNRYLSLINGQLVAVGPGRTLAVYPAKVPLSSSTTVAWPNPFADHERALVMLLDFGAPLGSSNPIVVVSVATGRQVSLGTGENVAGDPQARGVFVSVPAPVRPSAGTARALPDSGIVLRDAGRRPVLLASAADLNRDLGAPAKAPVSLAAYPAPSGARLAVVVQPTASDTGTAIVVLSRAGRLLGTARASLAPGSVPVWSPSGRSLAYLTSGTQGPGLAIRTIGGRTVARPLPHVAGTYSACIWSPDGKSVLCGGTDGGAWAIARADSDHAVAVRGSGAPITWLP